MTDHTTDGSDGLESNDDHANENANDGVEGQRRLDGGPADHPTVAHLKELAERDDIDGLELQHAFFTADDTAPALELADVHLSDYIRLYDVLVDQLADAVEAYKRLPEESRKRAMVRGEITELERLIEGIDDATPDVVDDALDVLAEADALGDPEVVATPNGDGLALVNASEDPGDLAALFDDLGEPDALVRAHDLPAEFVDALEAGDAGRAMGELMAAAVAGDVELDMSADLLEAFDQGDLDSADVAIPDSAVDVIRDHAGDDDETEGSA